MQESRREIRDTLDSVIGVLSDGKIDAKSRTTLKRVAKNLTQALQDTPPTLFERIRPWLSRFRVIPSFIGTVVKVITFFRG